jgi:2-amino-4-hydroxy-6-hydroxymethyldihydropteridine diphosphokinase
MARVFIGLGSNLGDRAEYLQKAVNELLKLEDTSIIQFSSIYETEPVGIKEQPDFFNMVVEIDTKIPPKDLLKNLKEIEGIIGRTHLQHWGPREIDLDMLYYDKEISHDEKLDLPHPEITHRRFMLEPMKEIAADFNDPLQHLKISELFQRCSDTSAVQITTFSISLQQKVK